MPETNTTAERLPHVMATAETMIFSVASYDPKHQKKRYRVDLVANGGTIQCSCKNWGIEVWPNIRAGKRILDREAGTLCKHGFDALQEYARDILPAIAKTHEGEQ